LSDTPARIGVTALPGVRLPDGTPVAHVASELLERMVDLLVERGATLEVLTVENLALLLTSTLRYARTDGQRWAVDAFDLITDEGVTTVSMLAEHDDHLGWCLMMGVKRSS